MRRQFNLALVDAAKASGLNSVSNVGLVSLSAAPEAAELLARLGKHKVGAGCVYVNNLEDIDEDALAALIRAGYRYYTTVVHQP